MSVSKLAELTSGRGSPDAACETTPPRPRRSRPVAFEANGPPAAPAVVVLGGISADRHVASQDSHPRSGWWEDVVGRGKAIDTQRYRVISLDYAAPARVTTHTIAADVVRVLDELGIARAHALVGASFGGMVGLALAHDFPERVDRLIAISAPHRSHPTTTAWRSLQRRVVRLGKSFGATEEALSIARGIAMVTYRTPEEFLERFDSAPGPADPVRADSSGLQFPVESYLEARGEAYACSADPQRFERLSFAMDLHRVDPSAIRVPTTIVGVPEDRLVRWEQLEELCRELGGPARLHRLESLYGHDAFLKEHAALGPILAWTLEGVLQ